MKTAAGVPPGGRQPGPGEASNTAGLAEDDPSNRGRPAGLTQTHVRRSDIDRQPSRNAIVRKK